MKRPSPATLAVLGLIGFLSLIRALVSLQVELTSVESYLWVCSRHPALGYFDYPAMAAWMIRLSTGLFGHGALGVRALTIAAGAGTIGFTYLAARRLYDERTGLLAALLVGGAPLFFSYGAQALPDAPMLCFWSAGVWALSGVFSGGSPRGWHLFGLCLGFAMDSKYQAVFLGIGVLVFLLLSPEHRGWLRRKEPWIAVLFALAAFSPTLIWNAREGWQSFLYQGVNRFEERTFQAKELYKFPLGQLLVLTPVFALGAWFAGGAALRRWRAAAWQDRFLAAVGMTTLLFFFGVLATRPVRSHWPIPAYLTLLTLSAAVVLRGGPWNRRLHAASLALLGLGYLAAPAAVSWIPKAERSGWALLATEVAKRNPDFVVGREYHLASQLAYWLHPLPAVEFTAVGHPSKSFPHWWRPEDFLGKNAVVVYDVKHWPIYKDRVDRAFERVDAPVEVAVPRFGGEVERYYLLRAWNYRGPR